MQKNVCLIIPCYQEATRLEQSVWPDQPFLSFIFVDDGSADETFAALKKIARAQDQVLRLPLNQGKAEAVRQGMLHALSSPASANAEWIGFWDADQATPLSEISDFLHCSASHPNAASIWGSRIYRCGARIERSFLRHILGRTFATVAKIYLGLETYDSQCGSKIFRANKVGLLFDKPFLSSWLFDVELYFRLRQAEGEIIEWPLTQWRDVPGGKLKIGRTAFRTIFDLVRIRSFYLR